MKSEIKHRMIRRLNGWDYCQRAIYSITVTLADRSRPWLGRLVTPAENGGAQDIPAGLQRVAVPCSGYLRLSF